MKFALEDLKNYLAQNSQIDAVIFDHEERFQQIDNLLLECDRAEEDLKQFLEKTKSLENVDEALDQLLKEISACDLEMDSQFPPMGLNSKDLEQAKGNFTVSTVCKDILLEN